MRKAIITAAALAVLGAGATGWATTRAAQPGPITHYVQPVRTCGCPTLSRHAGTADS